MFRLICALWIAVILAIQAVAGLIMIIDEQVRHPPTQAFLMGKTGGQSKIFRIPLARIRAVIGGKT